MWQRFVRWFSPETRFQRAWHIGVTAVAVIALFVLVGDGLYAIATNVNQARAQSARASLDSALNDATTNMNTPQGLLQPIRAQEQQVAAATDGSLVSYQHATVQYQQLRAKVDTIAAMPVAQARALAQKDLAQLQSAVAAMVKSQYADAPGYQGRLQQAETSFSSAKTTRDYFIVDSFAQDQFAAVTAYKPTLDRLVQFSGLVTSVRNLLGQVTGTPQPAPLLCAQGFGSQPAYFWGTYDSLLSHPIAQPGAIPVEAQWLADDQALFHAAKSAKDYEALNQLLSGQTAQVQATNATLVPSVAAKYLADFKADIDLLKNYQSSIPAIKQTFVAYKTGNWSLKSFASDITTFQKQYDQDAQLLANATFDSYSKAVQQIKNHRNGMRFQVIYAKTYTDVKTFGDLVAQGQKSVTHNPADGKDYPNAYEYADMKSGIGDIINPDPNVGRLVNASSYDDYSYLDLELQMFIKNISAMLTNLNDPLTQQEMKDKSKGWNQVHQTDISLMQNYGIMQGRVIVVSLREQAARMYENGQLVYSFQVTTGAPSLPSIPGMHCTIDKEFNTIFKSPDPPTDPNYYQPTPVNYAMIYNVYGYEIHDAWWRNEFGLYTNLPHHDPAAFNGGSHGCVNVSTANMKWLMDPVTGWVAAQDHTPMLIY